MHLPVSWDIDWDKENYLKKTFPKRFRSVGDSEEDCFRNMCSILT